MDRPNDMQHARAERTRLTYQDYLAFPDDGRRHELIDGEHVVTPAPALRHQQLSGRLYFALADYLRSHPCGDVYYAPADVILSDYDVVQPDLLFVSRERRDLLGDAVHGAPDLVIEIISPSSRRLDEKTKRALFEREGVREYWVVDPELAVVKVYARTDAGTFAPARELSSELGDAIETPLLPGFTVALRELFAD